MTISTFSGGISNSGTIDAGGAGIWVGGTTTNAAAGANVTASLTIATFSGGIGNSGTIDAGTTGIRVDHVLAFNGGISNAGSITASHYGIVVFDVSQFGGTAGGGITNSGTISVGSVDGIFVGGSRSATGVTNFAGGITNSGAITANFNAIQVDFVSTFTGGISNSGTISAGAGTAISVQNVSTFSGGIANSGTISAGGIGIEINDVAQFGSTSAGGITNSGTISAGASGVAVESVANFSDGISNFGTIVAALNGIFVGSDTTFAGGIDNSGTIRAAGTGNGINVNNDTYFTGGISNSGVISVGGVGIYVTDVSTFSGNISNSGKITAATGINIFNGVTFSAGAAVVNSGNITGTGGTAINVASAAGEVTVDQNAGTITGAIKLISTDDTLNVSGGTINGNIVGRGIGGGGTINFTLGAGNTFTYAAAYGFSGFDQVNFESGTVVLNGVNSAANIAVGSSLGGTLAGTGTIDPLAVTINAGGTLAPGLPGGYGTLNITGNLAFASGSYYAIDIAPGAGNNSKAALIGAATLGGNGTVEVTPQLGHYAAGTDYQILTTTSALTGTFAGLTVNGDHTFAASLDYTTNAPNDVDLDIMTSGYSLLTAPAGLNQNQQNVLNGINNAILQGDSIPTGFFNLGGLSGAALGNALTQLEGQPATGAQSSAFQLMTDFMNLLSDPSSGGGGSPTGGGAPGFAPEQEASLPSDIAQAYASILTKTPPQQSFNQRWIAWGSAYGGAAKLDGNPVVGSGDVTASDYGFAAGMDYRATPDSVYGFALAGGGTNWSVAGNLGTGRSDSFQLGVHDTTHWGPLYLSGALAFANHWFTTNRIAVGDNLTAKFDGQSYAARGEAGYRYAVPVTGQIIGVTPYAALQVQDFHTPGFSETDLTGGGLGLSFASQNATDTRSELGARFDNVQVVNAMPLVLRGRLAWAHDWISSSSLGAVFQALPGSNFTVNGAAPPTNSALTSASAELHLTTNWTAIAKFDGEFASDRADLCRHRHAEIFVVMTGGFETRPSAFDRSIKAALSKPFYQGHGACGCTHFAFMDDVGKDVARRGLGFRCRADPRQIGGLFAMRPGLQPAGPGVDLLRRIGRRYGVLAALQPGIDEVAGDVGDVWIFGVVGEYDRHFECPQQRNEVRRAETVMAHFDDVADRVAAEFIRQQFQEAAEIGGVEFFRRRELPEQGTETVAELGHAGIEKPLDRVAGLFEDAPVDGIARALEREHETRRHFARPFAKRRRGLRAVERAVDFDRGQPLAGIGQLLRVWQTLRIKHAAPRLERPAADADINFACFRSHGAVTKRC